jgi:isochorismate pyruvate lyase
MAGQGARVKVAARPRPALGAAMADQTSTPLPAADCMTMAEVRAGVDALDEAIVTLLGQRMRYMEAAARIKPERGDVRDEPRKAAVIEHAERVAAAQGFPPALAADLYELLVEGSIAYELEQFDERSRA